MCYKKLFAVPSVLVGLLWYPVQVVASQPSTARTGTLSPEVRVFDSHGAQISNFLAYDKSVTRGVRVAVGDVNGDGQQEIITGSGQGSTPEIGVFSITGTELSRFFAYGAGFRGGVNIAVFDLNSDGIDEIITGPGIGGGPEVRVYTMTGEKISSFFAYDIGFRGGVNVTAGLFGAHNEPRIITGSSFGGSHVRGFSISGSYTGPSLRPFGDSTYGVTVNAVNVQGQRSKLIVMQERLSRPTVKLLNPTSSYSTRATYDVYSTTYRGGVHVSSGDVNDDGTNEVVMGVGPGRKPTVRILTLDGTVIKDIEPYKEGFIGGTNVAAGKGIVATGPGAVSIDGRTDLYKYIEINLKQQTLRYYTNGTLEAVNKVSTGKWSTPTPIGTYAIKNKIPVAYSKPYDLYMEWWMAFTPDGSYGLHALPYWKGKNGSKRYEGVGHLGTPVSHGCIRQTLENAKKLYRWADIGTPVIVKR